LQNNGPDGLHEGIIKYDASPNRAKFGGESEVHEHIIEAVAAVYEYEVEFLRRVARRAQAGTERSPRRVK
jgi:hypothetical protein